MGVYQRPESKYWWLYLETSKERVRTDIPIGVTAAQKKDSKALALEVYHARMVALARPAHDLPEAPPEPAPMPTFDAFADWYDAHHISQHAGAEREREMLIRLRTVFGALPIDQVTKAAVIEWRTTRKATSVTVERFLKSGQPTVWRQIHALLQQRGPLPLEDIRAAFPCSTRDVCSTILGKASAPYFKRIRRGVWAAVGHPKVFKQTYAPPSAATVNREVDLLQQILQAAVEAGHLTVSPLYGLKNLPIIKPIRRTMSEAEEAALLEVLAPDDRAILLVGLDALVRMIDILDLEWADIHERRLDVRDPKNGESHTVPLSARLQAALAELPRTSRYCFPRRRQAVSQTSRRKAIANALKRACVATGLPYGRLARGLTFHWSTRRTGATRMIQQGGEKALAVVQRIGNWKNVNVLTGIYQEIITAEMEAAVDSVGAKVQAPSQPETGRVIHATFTGNSRIPK
jgi:integrase